MRYLDMETWPRREHYELFGSMNHPHVGPCANLDVTPLRDFIRERCHSFNTAVMYLLGRVANSIPTFRQRIRDSKVVEHDRVDPSYTILIKNEVFSFCTIEYGDDFPAFAHRATQAKAHVEAHPTLAAGLEAAAARDDLLYISVIPWVSFTAFQHPMPLHPADSIPRFAVGKYFADERMLQMPLGVQGHHALVDGLHIGRFYQQMQELLSDPRGTLGG